LLSTEMPGHSHTAMGGTAGGQSDPTGNTWGTVGTQRPAPNFYSSTSGTQMSPLALSIAGGSLPHNNMMPFLTLIFCIALQGVFPQRP